MFLGELTEVGQLQRLAVIVRDPRTTMRIVATFSRGALINASYVLALPDFAANVTSQLDAAILITLPQE